MRASIYPAARSKAAGMDSDKAYERAQYQDSVESTPRSLAWLDSSASLPIHTTEVNGPGACCSGAFLLPREKTWTETQTKTKQTTHRVLQRDWAKRYLLATSLCSRCWISLEILAWRVYFLGELRGSHDLHKASRMTTGFVGKHAQEKWDDKSH
jgi:hypothetical protein